jgi:hypothetical protein
VHVEDYSSSKLQIIDDITKLSQIVEFTQQFRSIEKGSGNENMKKLIEELLLPWPRMSREK